jgi:hypothetical protein
MSWQLQVNRSTVNGESGWTNRGPVWDTRDAAQLYALLDKSLKVTVDGAYVARIIEVPPRDLGENQFPLY